MKVKTKPKCMFNSKQRISNSLSTLSEKIPLIPQQNIKNHAYAILYHKILAECFLI